MPKRILVYGVTGSGKTTLARQISEVTGIPWQEVEQITWEPGWKPVPPEIQRERIVRFVQQDEWILDTAYGIWVDVPLQRAELIVALDFPRWVSLSRLVKRTIQRAIDKKTVCNGNVESWRQVFSKDSIIAWHFRSFHSKRNRIDKWQAETPERVVRLKSPRQVQDWLIELNRSLEP
jgi:adenylate kinase family enzyme